MVGNGNGSDLNPLECDLSHIGMCDNREWLRADQPVGLGLFVGVFIHWLRPMHRLNKNKMVGSLVYRINMVLSS